MPRSAAVFIGDYPKEICFAQQLSANRCYLASPGPFGSKAREVIRLFPGLFLYRNQEDAAVRKKFVRAWKPQSEHTYKSLFIFRQKKLCLAAPSRGFFMFLSYFIRPRPKLAPSSASFAGMAAAPQGLFLYDKFGKDECSCAFAKPNARLRDCALYGVQRFFDRVRQPVPAVLACGKDLLQIGHRAGFF